MDLAVPNRVHNYGPLVRQVATGLWNNRNLIRRAGEAVMRRFRGNRLRRQAPRRTNKRKQPRRKAGKSKGIKDSQIVSKYHEDKVLYRGGGKRRTKFQKKVQSIINDQVQPQWIVRQGNQVVNCTANHQNYIAFGMYTYQGTAGDWDDLNAISNNLSNAFTPDSNQGTYRTGNKVNFKRATLDVILTNAGSNPLTIDIYDCITRLSVQETQGDTPFTNGDTNKWTGAGAVAFTGNVTMGITPFQSNNFVHHYRIVQKRRVLLNTGETTQYRVSDYRQRMLDGTILNNEDTTHNACLKGWTRLQFIMFYGSDLDSTAGQTTAGKLCAQYIRKYDCKIINMFGPSTGTL